MKTILFDIDGTLTEARKFISDEMIENLYKLTQKNIIIGLVTGSNFDYINEQILSKINFKTYRNELYKKLILFPCNGTKKYVFNSNKWDLEYSAELKKEIDNKRYNKIIKKLLKLEKKFIIKFNPVITGNFISYRESMLNWCPIGRDSKDLERKAFIELDKKNNYRKSTIKKLRDFFINNNIKFNVSFGGDTSFDIFPAGWDKTYVMKHFKDKEEIYFIGDRCYEGGNDFELYLLLKGKSYITNSPENTISLLKEIFGV